MDKAFAEARRFFALPLADKEAIAMRIVGGNRGYAGLLGEALDPTRGPDLKEAFNIGLDLGPDDPELLAGKPFRALNAWPASPGFRNTILAYFDACGALGLRVHRAFARDLGLPLAFFEDKFDRPMATLRLLRYPAAPTDRGADVGAGVHTDYGNITLLATDDVGGLQVQRRDGRWIDAPPLAGVVRGQHRRLPDALDERHLCLNPPSGDQRKPARALFDRLIFRPQSGRRSRGDSLLCDRGRAEVPSHSGGGISEAASRRHLPRAACRGGWLTAEIPIRALGQAASGRALANAAHALGGPTPRSLLP